MPESKGNCSRGFVAGHGIDLVDIEEFSRLLKEPARNYLPRYFTPGEIAAAGSGENQLQKLAGRFAVKEAVMKALCRGWGDGIAFTDVEVVTHENGIPTVVLRGELARIEQERTIVGWVVTTSHSTRVAVASVIALGL